MPDIRSRKHAHSILVQIASHAFALLAAHLQFSILDLVFTQESSLLKWDANSELYIFGQFAFMPSLVFGCALCYRLLERDASARDHRLVQHRASVFLRRMNLAEIHTTSSF
jgi:TRAP-type C4-dicarboxylate transport system permease small subunit